MIKWDKKQSILGVSGKENGKLAKMDNSFSFIKIIFYLFFYNSYFFKIMINLIRKKNHPRAALTFIKNRFVNYYLFGVWVIREGFKQQSN